MKQDHIHWTFEDGELTVFGIGPIPNHKYDERTPWEDIKPQIQTLCIERGITGIGAYAFSGCHALETVFLADTVRSVGFSAFKDCATLQEVDTLLDFAHRLDTSCPDKDAHLLIGIQAFHGTPWLKETYGDFYIRDHILIEYLGDSSTVTVPEGVTEIGSRAFENRAVTQISFPDTLKIIRAYAFMNAGLKSLTLPASLVSIEDYAFGHTAQLEQVIFSEKCPHIGQNAFYGSAAAISTNRAPASHAKETETARPPILHPALKSLSAEDLLALEKKTVGGAVLFILRGVLYAVEGQENDLILPEGILRIRPQVFRGRSWLETAVLPEGMKKIGNHAFANCANLKKVIIPDSVSQIEDYAFASCSKLESIRLPDKIQTIRTAAFRNCTSLTSVIFPRKLTKIEEEAFFRCSRLAQICLPDKVKYIGKEAFASCTGLTQLKLPNQLEYLGYGAFKNCASLPSVTIPESVTQIGACAFSECGLEEVIIPTEHRRESPLSLTDSVFSKCAQLEQIHFYGENYSYTKTVFEETPWLASKGPFVIFRSKLLAYQGDDRHVVIPDGVTSIGACAFSRQPLISVEFPHGLKEIGAAAFAHCEKLTSARLPEGLDTIDCDVFCGCTALAEVIFPESLTHIGSYAFKSCTSLEDIELPPNVNTLHAGTFAECTRLRSVILPVNLQTTSSVSYIRDYLDGGYAYDGSGVFEDCTSLKQLLIPACVERIGYRTFSGCDALELTFEEGFAGIVETEGKWQ